MKKTIHGVDTNYQVMGKGTPLVMLHGWGCDWQIWYPITTALSEHFQLFIPDLPAFGGSGVPDTVWDSFEYEKWLTAFVNEVTPNQDYFLMGHSYGGKVAALHAAHQPSHLQKIILVDSAGLPIDLTSQQQTQQTVLGLIPEFIKKPLRSTLLKKAGASSDYANSLPHQQPILKKIVREDISTSLAAIQAPTLLIWGEKDLDTPVEKAYRFQKLITDSELFILATAGHFPFIDAPEEFIKTTKRFLLS